MGIYKVYKIPDVVGVDLNEVLPQKIRDEKFFISRMRDSMHQTPNEIFPICMPLSESLDFFLDRHFGAPAEIRQIDILVKASFRDFPDSEHRFEQSHELLDQPQLGHKPPVDARFRAVPFSRNQLRLGVEFFDFVFFEHGDVIVVLGAESPVSADTYR